jgi:hypothetical protein
MFHINYQPLQQPRKNFKKDNDQAVPRKSYILHNTKQMPFSKRTARKEFFCDNGTGFSFSVRFQK